MHIQCRFALFRPVAFALFTLAILETSACGSGPTLPDVPATPVPTPTATPTPEMKLFSLPSVRQEVGCGFGCAWYYSANQVTRTNDPLVSNEPLAVGEEFAVIQVSVEAKGAIVQIVPEKDLRVQAGSRVIAALATSKLRLPNALPITIAKGERQDGKIVFKIRRDDSLGNLLFRDETKVSTIGDTSAPLADPRIPTATAAPVTVTPIPATATPVPPTSTATPVPDQSIRISALAEELNRAWSAQDWSSAIKVLTDLRALTPEDTDQKDKLYAAHINRADQLLASGDRGQAASQLNQAVRLDPTRGEATSRQQALTPAPVPPTSTLAPKPAAPPPTSSPPRPPAGSKELTDWHEETGSNLSIMIPTLQGFVDNLGKGDLLAAANSCERIRVNYDVFMRKVKQVPTPALEAILDDARDAVYIAKDACAEGLKKLDVTKLNQARNEAILANSLINRLIDRVEAGMVNGVAP